MADLFLYSGDGADGDSGLTWALAKATLATGIAGIDATNDRVLIDSRHSEAAASITYAAPGTPSAPNQLLSVTQTGTTGIASLTAGATFDANSSFGGISFTGSTYIYGVNFLTSTTSSAVLGIGTANGDVVIAEDCSFKITGGGTSGSINLGNSSAGGGSRVTLINPTFQFSATGQRIFYFCDAVIRGGAWSGSGTLNPSAVFNPSGQQRGSSLLVDGFDFSNLNAATNLHGAGQGGCKAQFRNCKLPSSWTGAPIADASLQPGQRVEMYNCDSGSTNYRLWIKEYAGSVRDETTIVRTGGASDGTTGLAWKMVTTANNKYPNASMVSPEIMQWVDSTGSSLTATVEIVHDSQGAGSGSKFQDDEIWIEIEYLGTSGNPLASFVDDAKTDVIATAANQADSTETWTTTGLSSPVKQKLSASFTPQKKGYVIARVVMAKASKTVYICPKMSVA